MGKAVTTVCRTIGIVAVWMSSMAFLTNGLTPMGMPLGRDALPFYLLAIAMVVFGAVLATAILWLAGRPRRVKPYAGEGFDVVPQPVIPPAAS